MSRFCPSLDARCQGRGLKSRLYYPGHRKRCRPTRVWCWYSWELLKAALARKGGADV